MVISSLFSCNGIKLSFNFKTFLKSKVQLFEEKVSNKIAILKLGVSRLAKKLTMPNHARKQTKYLSTSSCCFHRLSNLFVSIILRSFVSENRKSSQSTLF